MSVASTLSEACLVSYQDARCSLHSIGHSLYESPPDVFYGFSSLLFFFSFLTFCFLCLFCFCMCSFVKQTRGTVSRSSSVSSVNSP